ncbi:MAG TPA: transposase, partial [Cyanobacteria bacterium UBA11166]|nr:transposase [Cyanobacteria bacterium UBA11166]
QLKYGQGYSYLNPVIGLTITDFTLFPSTQKVITSFHFQEQEEKLSYQEKQLKLFFVELPKFTKKLEELETLADKWIYFLKEAPSLEVIPPKMSEIPQIEKAMNIANQAGLSVEELERLNKQEIFLEDRRGEITLAKIEGERNLLLRQLQRRLGELTSNVIMAIEGLNSQGLESLSEAMWDFSSMEDLLNWLAEYSG